MNYATIFLDDENINESVVEAGWGKVKDIKNQSDDYKKLIALQKAAEEQKIGVWSNSEKYAKQAKTEDPQALLKSFKGKTVDVIVEYVISGTALKVRLPTNEVVFMNLTGVYCPSTTKGKETQQKVAQPFSKEAKTHTEVRLLNRDVTVLFEGIDTPKKDKSKDGKDAKEQKEKTSNLHGSIIISVDENSDKPFTYQEELLMIGYVSVDERSAPKSKYAPRFRSAEQKAKNERKNLWVDYEPPKQSLHQSDTGFTARVLEVLSGDTLKIVKNDGQEEKISLSNIRTKKFISYTKKPEKKEASKQAEQKPESEQWAWEARELLRSKVAGKEIQVEVDYRRELGTEKKELRRFCTVLVNKKSVAVELVREGYAEVMKLKADEERSSAFDSLILAENEAIKRQKGLHGKKRAPQHPYTVVSGDAAGKLNKLLTGKSGNTKAVVEKILSASKFVLSLPNDASVVTFSLAGIAIPSSDKPLGKDLAEEAKQLTLISTSCRDVELVLEAEVDKASSLTGQMLINGKNYTNTLLEAGLAIVQPYAKRLKIFEELNEAEGKAKKAKKGVWKLEDHTVAFPERKKREQPEQEQKSKPVAQSFSVSHSRKTQTIRVTDFEDPITFYYQGSDVVEKLKTVEKLIAELNVAQLEALASATVGSVCLAQFTEDNSWYRAKVISVNNANAVVLYSDFGNSEEVAISTLKTIPAGNQLLTIPECAQKARLAFVKDHENLRFELETFLRETLMEGEWQLTVEYSDAGVNYVTLVQNGAKQEDNLNKQMIRSGLVFADKKLLLSEFKSVAKSYLEEQDFAISRRLNLWELGEIYGSDDDEY